jgi:hypothetical protein
MNLKNTEGEMKDEVVEEEEDETKETATADLQQQQEEEEDACPVCIEPLQKDTMKFFRYSCCGKGIHLWCHTGIKVSSLSHAQKNTCPLCRANHPASQEEAIEKLRPWVEKGKAWAQCLLGQRYEHGLGVDQSYQQARELYELSATQGDAGAQYNLGVMYNQHQGQISQYNMDQSYERAAEYYEAAARQGMPEAQHNLGLLYATGQGVEQSFESARKWMMKAAEQGDEDAINELQRLDEFEGRTTPSFTAPKRCSLCDTPETPTHKLNDCPCFGAQYCNAKCQTSQWKMHKKEHRRLCQEMKLVNTESETKDGVVVEEEGKTKEMASADLSQQEQEDDDDE